MQCKQKEQDLEEKVIEISTERLKGFKNHPFKVKNDQQMEALRESIGRFGILNPIIVRPKLEGYYEIVSGHRRCEAARQLGFTKVPVLIRVLSDDEAILEMVDSNVQREQISPSEKAFAYRMKYDVLRRSVGRPKSGQIGYVYPKGKSPLQEIGAEAGDSQKQVQRYIRITYLIPEFLKLLDEGMLAFNPAVDISFLSEEEQKELLNAMDATQSSPSISQAQRIKDLSKSGNCTREKMQEILGEIKKGETNRVIGDTKLRDINTRFIEQFYQELLVMPAISRGKKDKVKKENSNGDVRTVGRSTIRDIHKILRNCFQQAVKWDLMEKNPALLATVPKHKAEKREIWTAETLMHALEVCDDDRLRIALNLAFSCSLRMGEILGLTWDCCDISKEAIETNQAYIYVNKELQRVTKDAVRELDAKDILLIFPEKSKTNTTVLVLKTPKTESSVRKVFLPRSVAEMMVEWKNAQEERKDILGSEYTDYNLVMAGTFGYPLGDTLIRGALKKLIKEHDLPPVVFHSLRHTSVTYKLKLNGGDVKAVQGDSGHAQVSMVTDVYSHIIDDDRKQNAILFEGAFYAKKNLDPKIHETGNGKILQVPEGVDAEVLAKVLGNPELTALLTSLARTLEGN